jgi:hypothetical protein
MKITRISLGILLFIIAINAFGGGYYGMAGAEAVPTEWLEGSPFKTYFLPALFLFAVVGGSCLVASISAFGNFVQTRVLSISCGCLLLLWITAQVLIIGYVSWMQPAIFISAIIIIFLANSLKHPKLKSI